MEGMSHRGGMGGGMGSGAPSGGSGNVLDDAKKSLGQFADTLKDPTARKDLCAARGST